MTLRTYSVSPPGGYRYIHPESESKGHVSYGITFSQLVQNAERHRQNMNYPQDVDLATDIENALCVALDPEDQREYCNDAPPAEWPLALQPMKLLARPGDKGLGDVVDRVVGPAGGDAYKAWFLKVFGVTCGCKRRQDRLNRLYPL